MRNEKGQFVRGHIVPIKWRESWRNRFKGIHFSPSTEFKKGRDKTKHYNWKGGITPLIYQIRNSQKYIDWRNTVYQRDNYECQNPHCGDKKGGNLEAHHIILLTKILIEKQIKTLQQAFQCLILFSIDLGITLCEGCHHISHDEDPLL